MESFVLTLSSFVKAIHSSGQWVCNRTKTVSRTVCDATEVLSERICYATEQVTTTVCDATENISETVCDSWKSIPVVGGLICAASHTVSRTVCIASHVVSTVVCTASHVVSKSVCIASHVVGAVICIGWMLLSGIFYVLLGAVVDFLRSFIRSTTPTVRLIVETIKPMSIEDVQSLVNTHLERGWRVEKAYAEFDPRRDLPRLNNFYFVTKSARLTENVFDLCYRLQDRAGFAKVDPDPPYSGFLGGPTL